MSGNRMKVKSKEEIGSAEMGSFDMFGNRLSLPPHIKKELEAKNLVHRFVSVKILAESGGYHPKGWVPYKVEKPETNPITGQADAMYRVGDLILAVKTKDDHTKHLNYLKQRSSAQASHHKNSVKEMRDRIRDGKADKHISLIEGYEENDTDE